MATEFTEQDLIEAILAAQSEDPCLGAVTSAELQEQTKLPERAVLKRLRQLDREGKLEVVRVRRKTMTGVVQRIPGYRLKATPKGE